MTSAKLATKHHSKLRRFQQIALIVAFIAIIYLPGIGMIVRPKETPSQGDWEENRSLPKFSWKLSSIISYPKDFGEYFRFNFGFRRTLIHWHTQLAGKAMDQSSSSQVVEGKNGWLFYGQQYTVDDYRGLNPFTPEQLQQWQYVLERQRDWLAEMGIPFLFIVCPDKHTVYPEYMPDRLNRVHDRTRFDQFVQYMKKNSTVEILDLRPTLWDWKTRYRCYQPQETHWNGIGAFAAYQQIIQRLRTWYPGLRPIEIDECSFYQRQNPTTDLLHLQGKQNIVTSLDALNPTEGFACKLWTDVNEVRTDGSTALYSQRDGAPIRKALMICDSFSSLMMPFLAEHFVDAKYVWGGGNSFLAQDVLDWQPDIVLQEIVERGLCEITPRAFEMPGATPEDPNVRPETEVSASPP